MEKKAQVPLTPFDRIVTDDFLQMIKILIPYLPPNMQRMAGIYVKMTELSYIISKPQFTYRRTPTMDSLLEEMQPYLPSESRQMVSEFQQFFEMFEMMQNIDLSNIMQSMDFGDMSNIFQTERNDDHERMDESSAASESGSDETGTV